MGRGGFPPGSHACLSVLPAVFLPSRALLAFPSSRSPFEFPSSSVCSLALAPFLPPSPASSEPSVSFLFLFVWRTKAVRAAKGNEFKEAAILDFLRTGECAHARVCASVCTHKNTHTHAHAAEEGTADS